jgi:hypothetical protein
MSRSYGPTKKQQQNPRGAGLGKMLNRPKIVIAVSTKSIDTVFVLSPLVCFYIVIPKHVLGPC